jgi:hypothetical protein
MPRIAVGIMRLAGIAGDVRLLCQQADLQSRLLWSAGKREFSAGKFRVANSPI